MPVISSAPAAVAAAPGRGGFNPAQGENLQALQGQQAPQQAPAQQVAPPTSSDDTSDTSDTSSDPTSQADPDLGVQDSFDFSDADDDSGDDGSGDASSGDPAQTDSFQPSSQSQEVWTTASAGMDGYDGG